MTDVTTVTTGAMTAQAQVGRGQQLRIDAGELTTLSRLRRRGTVLIGGGAFWLLLFLAVPLALVFAAAFCETAGYGAVKLSFTWDNLGRVAGWGVFGWQADNLRILLRTVVVAGLTTVVCLAMALPMAFWIARQPPARRGLLLALLMIPFCTNLVIRTVGWVVLLSNQSWLAGIAQLLGLIRPEEGLYPGTFAVLLGMVTTFLPFAVLPLYAVVERLDWSLVEAARDLHAGPWRTARHAILPQIMPGLVAAGILTFVPALGMFLVTDRLGSGKFMLVGNLIQQQVGRDTPYLSALCLTLVAATLVGIAILRWRAREVPVA